MPLQGHQSTPARGSGAQNTPGPAAVRGRPRAVVGGRGLYSRSNFGWVRASPVWGALGLQVEQRLGCSPLVVGFTSSLKLGRSTPAADPATRAAASPGAAPSLMRPSSSTPPFVRPTGVRSTRSISRLRFAPLRAARSRGSRRRQRDRSSSARAPASAYDGGAVGVVAAARRWQAPSASTPSATKARSRAHRRRARRPAMRAARAPAGRVRSASGMSLPRRPKGSKNGPWSGAAASCRSSCASTRSSTVRGGTQPSAMPSRRKASSWSSAARIGGEARQDLLGVAPRRDRTGAQELGTGSLEAALRAERETAKADEALHAQLAARARR